MCSKNPFPIKSNSMATKASASIQQLILDGLSKTLDGVGIFDPDDILIYCNESCATLWGLSVEQALNLTFSELIRHSLKLKTGVHLENPNTEEWLAQANSKRRSSNFRSFEVDSKDDHWTLVTEQLIQGDYIFMYCSDITEKKRNEQQLIKATNDLFKQATTDPLTQIYNRRHFLTSAEIELSRCQRHDLPISLLIIDLDNFKNVNDLYGHDIGDHALCMFVANAQQQLRNYDIFARFGGEEFIAILPDTNKDNAIEIANRIRRSTEAMPIKVKESTFSITISIGLAFQKDHDQTLENLIKCADVLLYQAKNSGRNKVAYDNHTS